MADRPFVGASAAYSAGYDATFRGPDGLTASERERVIAAGWENPASDLSHWWFWFGTDGSSVVKVFLSQGNWEAYDDRTWDEEVGYIGTFDSAFEAIRAASEAIGVVV